MLEPAMAAVHGDNKTCGNPSFGQVAREGGNTLVFDMAPRFSDPRYATSPSPSSAPRDVDSRPERFVAAAGQAGLTPSQDVVKTAGRRERKRKWEPGGVEFEKLATTMEKMVAMGQKALGKAERRRPTQRGRRAGSHVQGRHRQPQDPTTGRFVAGGRRVVSSLLGNRKSEATGQLVAVVASGGPHRRDRAAFLEEKKKRKAAQREASKLHKVVELMQRAAAADAQARVEEGQRRESEEAAEAQMREVVVAKAREEARLEIDREKEEARGQVRAAEERAEQAQARAAVAEARVAELEETSEGRVATVRKEKEEVLARVAGLEREKAKDRMVAEAARKRLEYQAVEHRESFRCLKEENARVRSERRAAEAALQVVTRERDDLRSCSLVQAISEGAAQVPREPAAVKKLAVRKTAVQKPAKKRPAPFRKMEDKHRSPGPTAKHLSAI